MPEDTAVKVVLVKTEGRRLRGKAREKMCGVCEGRAWKVEG